MAPDGPDVVEEILPCRVDVLCRRSNDPERMGRDPVDGLEAAAAPRPSYSGVSMVSTDRFSPTVFPSPLAAERWF